LRLTLGPIQNAPALQQRRNLSIHEYRSAKLLESYGIGVPKGDVAHSAAEAEQVAKGIRTLNPTPRTTHTCPC
jgi:succinyl-CoA synthetase beta subunit